MKTISFIDVTGTIIFAGQLASMNEVHITFTFAMYLKQKIVSEGRTTGYRKCPVPRENHLRH